jgi:hypothetical protein
VERFGGQRARQHPQHRDARRAGDRDLDFAIAERAGAGSWKDSSRARHNAHQHARSAELRAARPHQVHPDRLSSPPAPRTSRRRDLPPSANSYTSRTQGEKLLFTGRFR